MSLRDEISVYLDQVARPGPFKARNIAVVESFYGFGEADWPTLEAVGRRFGIGTRERVRQIVNADFRSAVRVEHLIRLQAAARLLESRELWCEGSFLEALSQALGAPVEVSSAGLLSLLQDLGLAKRYALFDVDLERLSPRRFRQTATRLIASAEKAASLQACLRRARTASSRLGLVNTAGLRALAGPDHPELKALLRRNPAVWSSEGEEFWFCAPGDDSALLRLIRKVFVVTEELAPATLAAALHSGLAASLHRHARPEPAVIEEWLRQADVFAWQGDKLACSLPHGVITPLEQAIVSRLSDLQWWSYTPIKTDLIRLGFDESTFAKLLTQSSLVEVDRSAGAKSYRYRLIGPPRPE